MLTTEYGFTCMHILHRFILNLTLFKLRKFKVIFFLITAVLISDWTIIQVSAMSGRHIRNPLLRTVYTKMLEDARQRNDDHSYVSTYEINFKFSIITCINRHTFVFGCPSFAYTQAAK